jgi:iron(III) transport system ATP-binding protein
MIECRQLKKRFGPVVALDEVNLSVAAGECVAVVGPSGGGKTTLLRLVAGLERADAGTISIAGQLVSNHAVHVEPARRGIGMMFQQLALWPHLTVARQLALVLHAWPKAERARRVEEMLALVKLDDKAGRYPHELSGGEQQRLALARALAPAPKILLLDEPLSNLDPELRRELRAELVRIIGAAGTTTLLVTHLPEDAEAMASRALRMEKGRLL